MKSLCFLLALILFSSIVYGEDVKDGCMDRCPEENEGCRMGCINLRTENLNKESNSLLKISNCVEICRKNFEGKNMEECSKSCHFVEPSTDDVSEKEKIVPEKKIIQTEKLTISSFPFKLINSLLSGNIEDTIESQLNEGMKNMDMMMKESPHHMMMGPHHMMFANMHHIPRHMMIMVNGRRIPPMSEEKPKIIDLTAHRQPLVPFHHSFKTREMEPRHYHERFASSIHNAFYHFWNCMTQRISIPRWIALSTLGLVMCVFIWAFCGLWVVSRHIRRRIAFHREMENRVALQRSVQTMNKTIDLDMPKFDKLPEYQDAVKNGEDEEIISNETSDVSMETEPTNINDNDETNELINKV